MSSLTLLLCVFLVSVSALLSSAEIALFTLSRFQLRSLKERVRPSVHRRIRRLLGDPGGLLVSILVVNEILNVSLSAVITREVSDSGLSGLPIFGFVPPWLAEVLVGTLISAPVVLFACEVTPKVIGARANQLVAPLAASPLTLVYDGLTPVRVVLKRFVNWVARVSNPKEPGVVAPGEGGEDAFLREQDFLLMVEEGHKEGAIAENEMELIRNVFELDDTPVSDLMTPINQVRPLPAETTVRNALATMRSLKYSRMPISNSRRQIVGILYTKDLLRAKLEPEFLSLRIEKLMRKPLVVSSTMRLNALFRKFKAQRTHMAVVVNALGQNVGVVTMSDVLDALFEDLLEDEAGDEE